MGEPSADAHQRMKAAVYPLGRVSSPIVRPPMLPLSREVVAGLARDLERVGMTPSAVAA